MRVHMCGGLAGPPQSCKFLHVPVGSPRISHIDDIHLLLSSSVCLAILGHLQKIVRRLDTSRTCVQVISPLVRIVFATEILNPRHLLPRPFGLQGILQPSQPSSVKQPGQLCFQLGFVQSSSSSKGIGDFFTIFTFLRGVGSARAKSATVGPAIDGPLCPCTSYSHASSASWAVF